MPASHRIVAALFFLPGGVAAAAEVKILLTGQTAARYDVRETAPEAFRTICSLLTGGDVVFTNFEGTLDAPRTGVPTRTGAVAHGVAPAVLDAVHAMGFNFVSLANNHANDLSGDGIFNTLEAATALHLAHAGTGGNVVEAAAPGYFTAEGGTKVALVAMASGSLRGEAEATATHPGVNALRLNEETHVLDADDATRTLASIRIAARRAEVVIVYQHNHYWETPNTKTPGWQKAWARACVDAGASVYVSHGAPLLHGLEIYHGRPIFYDLGNFIFQSTVKQEREIWESVVARATFDGGRLRTLELQPILLGDEGELAESFVKTRGLPAPMHGAEATALLSRVAAISREYGTELIVEGDRAKVKLGR